MIRDTSAQDQVIQQNPARRRLAWAIGLAAVLLVGAALGRPLLRMLSATSSVSASRLVLATVERGAFVRDVAADGRVVAAVRPTLYAGSGGRVELQVHAGDAVTEGQVLAVVDSPELRNHLAQEQSALDALQVDWQRARLDANQQRLALQKAVDNALIDQQAAERELERNRRAFAAGAIPGQAVSRAEDDLAKAEIALRHARSDFSLDSDSLEFEVKARKLAQERQALLVADVERQVQELEVRSPVDGQVGQLFVAPRATVARDAPLLTVIDLSALEVEVQVPESFARDLAIGMAADISGSGRSWKGAVSSISPEVVNGQVAARVRFVDAEPEQLRQNQRLSVRVLLDEREDVLTVSRGSFVDQAGGRHAWVVREGMATRVPVRLGASSINKVEILEGLEASDTVVISGSDNFGDAERVAIAR